MGIPRPARVELEFALQNADLEAIPFGPDYPRFVLHDVGVTRTEHQGQVIEHVQYDGKLLNYEGEWTGGVVGVAADRDPDEAAASLVVDARPRRGTPAESE